MHICSAPSVHSCGKLRQPPRVVQQLTVTRASKLVLPGQIRQTLNESHPCPDPDEERSVIHDALMQAVDQSKHGGRIEGLQEFAAAIWERKRRIPSMVYNDPLQRLFEQFDLDGDGQLTAREVAAALQCRGVKITEDVVQQYIDDVDTNDNGTVERHEWEHLIFHMARVDLRTSAEELAQPAEQEAPAST